MDISPNSALRPSPGRFLAVDPIEGGCANDYVYVYGDPVNTSDLSGKNIFGDIWDAVKEVADDAWDTVYRNVFTCNDTTFTRAVGALSLLPPFGKGGSKRAWGGSATGWLNFTVGVAVGYEAAGKLGRPALTGLAGNAVRAGSGVSAAISVAATVYDVSRRFACSNR